MTQLTNEALITELTGPRADFVSPAIIGASFYGTAGGIQTAYIQVTGFVGIITFQATLNDIADQAAWFDVDTYGDGIAAITETTSRNLIGNFVFVRAVVTDFTAGTINTVTLAY
jgi:hypothetical protein